MLNTAKTSQASIRGERVASADVLKCTGIIMVCYGHAPGKDPILTSYLMSFHMPLFFFLSGFLVKDTYLYQPLRAYSKYQTHNLLIPWAFWGTSLYLLWALPFVLFHPAKDVLAPLRSMAYGIAPEHCGPLWFLPCLFSVHVIFWCICRVGKEDNLWIPWAIAGVGLVANRLAPTRLPWGIDIACLALPFYWVGHQVRTRQSTLPGSPSPPATLSLVALGLCASVVSVINNQPVGMLSGEVGNAFLFYLGAFGGILTWYTFCQWIPTNALIGWISTNTMILFLVHRPFFKQMYTTVPSVLGLDGPPIRATALGAVVYTVLGMLV